MSKRSTAVAVAGVLVFSVVVTTSVVSDGAAAAGGYSVGLVNPASGEWHLRDASGGSTSFYYGNPGDYPIMGDWDCDGMATPGMYRQSDGFVYLRNSNTQGVGDIRFFFGNPGDVPIAGDFNSDGCDTVSIYRPSEGRFFIINKLGVNEGGLGAAETDYLFGDPGDKAFVGDFDGDGMDTVGLHRETTGLVYFRNSHTQGAADNQFIFGDPGDRLVAHDWSADGIDTPALFRPASNTFYFRHTNTQGIADGELVMGASDWLPVAGYMGTFSGSVTTTTMAAGSHPTSGEGWKILRCAEDVEASTFGVAEECARVRVASSIIPPDYILYMTCFDPFGFPYPCNQNLGDQWSMSGGWTVAKRTYNGGFLSALTFEFPINSAGEKSATFCRTNFPSNTCAESIFTANWAVTP